MIKCGNTVFVEESMGSTEGHRTSPSKGLGTRFGFSFVTRFSFSFVTALAFLSLSLGAALLASSARADTKSFRVSVNVASACSLTATNDTPHTALISPGTYQTDIGSTTIKATCNDGGGLAIYAVGYTYTQYGKNTLTANINDEFIPSSDIATGTATSGTTSNWAMKLTAGTTTSSSSSSSDAYPITIDNGYDSYSIVPTTYTKVASRTSGTDVGDNATGTTLTTTYAAFISSSQDAGTYTGKVKYTIVHPISEIPAQPQTTQSGRICYYANTTTAVGTMGCQTISTTATSATLLASNFSREGYGFAGWSNKYDYETNTDEDLKFYGPQETISFTAGQYTGNNTGLSLYAVWVKSVGSLQDSTKVAELCGANGTLDRAPAPGDSTATLSSVSALTDQRDNQTYAIAKLADGNCWMIENLRLDNTAELTTLNTNNPLNDGANVTLKHNYTDNETYNTLSASSNVAYDADTAPDGWCTTHSDTCDDQSRINTINTTERANAPTSSNANIYSYGNYYNWYSATTGRGTYAFDVANSSTAGDLCPAGWRLPSGGNSANAANSDFWQLGLSIMGFAPSNNVFYQTEKNAGNMTAKATVIAYPNNFVAAGAVRGTIDGRGGVGKYWASTALSGTNAYAVAYAYAWIYLGTNNGTYKYDGVPIRCMVSGS